MTSKGFYVYSAISCVTDWTFSLLPIHLVWDLRLSYRDKISVICILGAGIMYVCHPAQNSKLLAHPPMHELITFTRRSASTATIIRLRYLYTLADVEDFLYLSTDVAIWSTIETGLAIIVAASATLRPLLRKWFGEDAGDDMDKTFSAGQHPYSKAGSCWETPNDVLSLGTYSHRGIGVTTVIDHIDEGGQKDNDEARAHGGEENRIPGSVWLRDAGSRRPSNPAPTMAVVEPTRPSTAWITVRRSLVQTTETE